MVSPSALPNLAVAVGAAAGGVARHMLTRRPSPNSHLRVLAVNVVGSAALAGVRCSRPLRSRPAIALLLGTGFCGGFTTFSTFAVDTVRLVQEKGPAAGVAYIALSNICSLLAVAVVYSSLGKGM